MQERLMVTVFDANIFSFTAASNAMAALILNTVRFRFLYTVKEVGIIS
jgi:hypothetical protein